MLETIDENKILESSSTESNQSKTGSETRSLTGSAIENSTKRTSSSISEIQSATDNSSIFEKTNQNSSSTNEDMNIDELKADAENLPDPIFRDVVSKKSSTSDSISTLEVIETAEKDKISNESENSRSTKENPQNSDDLVIGQSILRTNSPQPSNSTDSSLSSISDTSATSCVDPVPQPVFKNFVQNAEILKTLSSLAQQKSSSTDESSSVTAKSIDHSNPKFISESSNTTSSSSIAEMESYQNKVDNKNGYDENVDKDMVDNDIDDENFMDEEIGDEEIVDKDIIEDQIARSNKMSPTSKSDFKNASTNLVTDITKLESADITDSDTISVTEN